MKKCIRCGRILPDSYFAPHSSRCKICRRDYDWQYRYRLSPERYYELYESQGGRCKICGKELQDGEYLHVDHNKETGEVRGLLCGTCNRGLGFFKENPESLRKAAEYIEESRNELC